MLVFDHWAVDGKSCSFELWHHKSSLSIIFDFCDHLEFCKLANSHSYKKLYNRNTNRSPCQDFILGLFIFLIPSLGTAVWRPVMDTKPWSSRQALLAERGLPLIPYLTLSDKIANALTSLGMRITVWLRLWITCSLYQIAGKVVVETTHLNDLSKTLNWSNMILGQQGPVHMSLG